MTCPDPSSLMLRRKRRLETSVWLRCRWCRVCVLGFGAAVCAWSSRQVGVSPFAAVKDNGSGRDGSPLGSSPGVLVWSCVKRVRVGRNCQMVDFQ